MIGFYTTVVREVGFRDRKPSGGEPVRPPYRVGYLLGPFDSEPEAREQIPTARRLAEEIDPRCAFDAFGTCSIMTEGGLAPGVLNARAGLEI